MVAALLAPKIEFLYAYDAAAAISCYIPVYTFGYRIFFLFSMKLFFLIYLINKIIN